jgi:hypothetical protein
MTPETPTYRFTLALSQDEAETLARGVVPAAVQDVVISLLVDVQATPAEALAGMTRRRRRQERTA